MTLNVAASLSAEKSGVSVAGSLMWMKIRTGPAPIARAREIVSRSTFASPSSTLTTTGKKMISATITTFGVRPKPSQITSAAPIAMIGIACVAIRSG